MNALIRTVAGRVVIVPLGQSNSTTTARVLLDRATPKGEKR